MGPDLSQSSLFSHILAFLRRHKNLLVLVVVLIFLNLLTFKLSVGNSKSSWLGWKSLTADRSLKDEPAAVVYEMAGIISSLDRNRLTVENNGQTETFITPLTRYTLVSPLGNTEEWTTKIIAADSRIDFSKGDSVTLLVSGDRFAPADKNSFMLQRVIKVIK